MKRLVEFLRAVVRTEPSTLGHTYSGVKQHDRWEVIWGSRRIGRWTIALSTLYVGDQYDLIGSDSTLVTIRVTRSPR